DTHELYLAILRQQRPGDPSQLGDGPAWPAAPHTGIRRPSRARGSTAPSPDLVGRDRELAKLTAAWEGAADGEPGVVMVVGEAGIGKTRLAEALAAEVASAGATVLQSRCYETERSLFLQPVVEAVLPAVTGLPAAELRQLLGDDAPPF